jgi:hypothetical protein
MCVKPVRACRALETPYRVTLHYRGVRYSTVHYIMFARVTLRDIGGAARQSAQLYAGSSAAPAMEAAATVVDRRGRARVQGWCHQCNAVCHTLLPARGLCSAPGVGACNASVPQYLRYLCLPADFVLQVE